jgi:hypothetical protein
MYQNRNTYQVRKPYTKQHQFKETGITTQYIFSTHVCISRQRGGLAIKSKPEFRGRNIELVKKVNGIVVFRASASFVKPDGYATLPVAKFERILPGIYELGYFPGHSNDKVSIAPGCVAQMDWS